MSEQKHTPGPWVWHEGTPHITRNWDGRIAVIAIVDADLPWHEDRNCEGREQGANARLIAAAPELKDAAQEVEAAWVELCRVLPQDDRIELLEWGAMQRLRAALSKATGQS